MAWESWNKIPIIMSWKAGKYTFYVKKHHMLKTASLKSGDRHVDKPLYSWTRCLEMMPKNHLHWSRMIPTRKLFIISDFYTHGSRSFFLFLYGLEWFPTLVFSPPLSAIIWYWLVQTELIQSINIFTNRNLSTLYSMNFYALFHIVLHRIMFVLKFSGILGTVTT